MNKNTPRKMKDSGIEWIGEIPEGWVKVHVKYLCHMQSGDNLTAIDVTEEVGYPVYGGNGQRGYYHKYTNDGTHVLIGRQGALAGNIHLAKGKFWATDHAIVVYNNSFYLSEYLYYVFSAMNLNQYAFETAAQPGLAVAKILNLCCIITSNKSEQRRIADYLDAKCGEIDGLCADIEAEIATLEEYKKSVITEAVTKGLDPNSEMKDSGIEWIGKIPVGWKVSRLKYLFSFGKGLSITKENLIDSGLPVISYGQIHSKSNNGVNITDCLKRYVSYSYQKFYPICEVKQFDFVFADTSEDYDGVGNCVYKRDSSILFGGYHVILAHSYIKQDNRFLAYTFQTDAWRKQLRERVSGVKVFSITQKNICEASVILPPLPEQRRIADYLDAKCGEIDAMIATKREQLEVLAEYKKNVIYEVVTGKVEV